MSNEKVQQPAEIPSYTYAAGEFWLAGHFKEKLSLAATHITKFDGKTYVALHSFENFSKLVTSATEQERMVMAAVIPGLTLYSSLNCDCMLALEELEALRDANCPLINKYLDHLKEQ